MPAEWVVGPGSSPRRFLSTWGRDALSARPGPHLWLWAVGRAGVGACLGSNAKGKAPPARGQPLGPQGAPWSSRGSSRRGGGQPGLPGGGGDPAGPSRGPGARCLLGVSGGVWGWGLPRPPLLGGRGGGALLLRGRPSPQPRPVPRGPARASSPSSTARTPSARPASTTPARLARALRPTVRPAWARRGVGRRLARGGGVAASCVLSIRAPRGAPTPEPGSSCPSRWVWRGGGSVGIQGCGPSGPALVTHRPAPPTLCPGTGPPPQPQWGVHPLGKEIA